MQPDTKPKSKELGAGVAKIADLVSYQDGSIVSREIVRKPTGGVTVFALDEGQGLSEHTAPFDALVHVLEERSKSPSLEKHIASRAANLF
jgi:quercetin dioxygenase-like cupin family protein